MPGNLSGVMAQLRLRNWSNAIYCDMLVSASSQDVDIGTRGAATCMQMSGDSRSRFCTRHASVWCFFLVACPYCISDPVCDLNNFRTIVQNIVSRSRSTGRACRQMSFGCGYTIQSSRRALQVYANCNRRKWNQCYVSSACFKMSG